MISEKLQKFYTDLAEAKGVPMEKMINADGKVELDLTPYNETGKNAVELSNCYNNLFYFLDKLNVLTAAGEVKTLEINIGVYLALRYFHIDNNSISLELPPYTYKSTFVAGLALYKLLFTNEKVDIFTTQVPRLVENLYTNLPDFLRIKSWDDISSRLFVYIDKGDDGVETVPYLHNSGYTDEHPKAILTIYDGVDISRYKVDPTLPTMIVNSLGTGELYKEEIYKLAKKASEAGCKIIRCRYNFRDLGFGMEYAEKMFKSYNSDLVKFLNEFALA